jgi:hypothetical protein
MGKEEIMRGIWLLAGVALGCAHPSVRSAPTYPLANVPDSLIAEGLRRADIVVLATPDSMVAEQLIAPGMSFGRADAWWNARLTTEAVAKGKLNGAKRMDYGILPSWQTPPQPFKLGANQVMIQLSTRWETAPVVVGQRAIYFLKKCYNCVELPHRTQYRVNVSPWFAILTLIPERWPEVERLARMTAPGRAGAAPTVLMQQSPFAGASHSEAPPQ